LYLAQSRKGRKGGKQNSFFASFAALREKFFSSWGENTKVPF